MCRWMFVYGKERKERKTRARSHTRKRRSTRRSTASTASTTPTYTSLCYDNNGLFNQVMDSQSTEFPNNTDGFGLDALVRNDWLEYRSMHLPSRAPKIRSWLRMVDLAKPRMVLGHLRANTRTGMVSTTAHTHPYVIHGKRKTVTVVMNGYIDGYADRKNNVTDTHILAERLCEKVNRRNESLQRTVDETLRSIRKKFRMTLAVVVTEKGKAPKHYVTRCMNWDTEPPTLYHSKTAGIYASETLYDGGDWKIVPITRFY